MPTYAIGDVQGCYRELMQLLEIISFNEQTDTLWFVGDLVNRGPDSLKVLRFVKQLKNPPVVTLGNHDLHLICVANGIAKTNAYDTLDDVLQAPDKEALCDWLASQSLFHQDLSLKAVLVHAGIYPFWSLKQTKTYAAEIEHKLRGEQRLELLKHLYGNEPAVWQDTLTSWDRDRFIVNALTRMRFCNQQGQLDLNIKSKIGDQPAGFHPWFDLYSNVEDQTILFGHWAALEGKVDIKNMIALDTGCVWGGYLSAYCLETRTWFRVKSEKDPDVAR